MYAHKAKVDIDRGNVEGSMIWIRQLVAYQPLSVGIHEEGQLRVLKGQMLSHVVICLVKGSVGAITASLPVRVFLANNNY